MPDVELPVEPPVELFVVLPDVFDPVVLDVPFDVPVPEPLVSLEVVVPSVLLVVLDAPLVPTISVSVFCAVKVAEAVLPEVSRAVTW